MPRTPESQKVYNQRRWELIKKDPQLHAKDLLKARTYRVNNLFAVRQREKEKRFATKLRVLRYYSGNQLKCACCGEKEVSFLTIDHLQGKGNQHRKIYKIKDLYKWLQANGLPVGYQVFCMNCNFGKFICGKCPHKGVF